MSSSLTSIAIYSTGLLLTKATSLLMLPFLTHSLPVEEIGRLEFLASITAFAGLITGLAMHEALYRFAAESNQKEKRQIIAEQFYSVVWLSSLLFLPIVFAVAYMISHPFTDILISEVALVSTGLLLSAPLSMALIWLRIEDKVAHFITITLSGCAIQIGLIVLMLHMEMGVFGVLLSATISHLLQLCAFHLLGHLKLRKPEITTTKNALKYTLPIAFSGLIAFGLNGAEKWLIAISSSLETLAAYAISTKLALAMCILVQPFNMWWLGKRFGYLKNRGVEPVVSMTQSGITWIFMLASSLLFAGPLLISRFLPEAYSEASAYLLLPLSCALMKEISELVNTGLLYKQQSQKLLQINIQSLCLGAFLVALLWKFSIWGILTSLLLAQSFKLFSIYSISQKLCPLPYKLVNLSMLFVCYSGIAFISLQVENDGLRLSMAALSPLIVLLVANQLGLLPQQLSLYQLQKKSRFIKKEGLKQ